MTLNIERETVLPEDLDCEGIITEVVNAALDYAECPYEVELNVILTSDGEIAQLNREFRDLDRPTDVLSFPMIEYETPGDFSWLSEEGTDDYFNPESGELLLGDIVISIDKVKEQAKAYGHSRQRELGFLVAHSMLHLFGYDHMEPTEAAVMESKQRGILELVQLGR